MPEQGNFNGFPKETIKFYRDLKKDNSRGFFEKNRDVFDTHVMGPSREFVEAMGKKLEKISYDIHAEPRVDRSIFRIYRDARFSRDKTPYKTYLGLWFWDGEGKRMERPGYYFHLEPGKFMLGTGLYMFPDVMLKGYREYVAEMKHGDDLHKIVTALSKKGYYYGEEHYKKVPRGYDSGYKHSRYLLYNGLYAGVEYPITDVVHSKELINFCFERYRSMYPLHKWLCEMLQRIG